MEERELQHPWTLEQPDGAPDANASALIAAVDVLGSGSHLASLLENLPGCAYRCPPHIPAPNVLVTEHVTEGILDLTGYASTAFAKGEITWRELLNTDDIPMIEREVAQAVEAHQPYSITYRIRHRSGRELWVLDRGRAIYNEHGTALWLEGFISDISEQKETEAALRDSEEQLKAMLDAQPECVLVISLGGRIVKANPAGVAMVGHGSPADVIGRNVLTFIDPSDRDAVLALHQQALEGMLVDESCEVRFLVVGGTSRYAEVRLAPLRSADGAIWGVLIVARDITERKLAEERMEWLATHDPLTTLPNRALFQQRLQVATAHKRTRRTGLLIIDLDNFKQVNDTLGHDAGDALLCETARRLKDCCKRGWTVARLGGDEFAVILPGVEDRAVFAEAVNGILTRLREPLSFADKVLDSRASIGATLFPDDDKVPTDLLKNADLALYAAKAAGRGRAVHYAPEMRHEMQQRVASIRQFRTALSEDRVVAHYQPKVALANGSLAGFEALLRWHGEDGQIHRPGTAASAFEDAELAAAISERMIGKVLDDIEIWLNSGVTFGHVAVNVSALEFRQFDFAERLLDTLALRNVPPKLFQIEVTETAFLGQGSDEVERALNTLHTAGIHIALDDFGTGYASLSHLKRFPVGTLKIDQSFVHDLAKGSEDASIVGAVITLGHSLGKIIVAEGIENGRQAAYLRSQGCDIGQGYLFGVPMSADELAQGAFWKKLQEDSERWEGTLDLATCEAEAAPLVISLPSAAPD